MKYFQTDDRDDALNGRHLKTKIRKLCFCEFPKFSIKPNGTIRHKYCTECSGYIHPKRPIMVGGEYKGMTGGVVFAGGNYAERCYRYDLKEFEKKYKN